ncbi:MAG: hypothetical protein DM484_03870 [Candidatus Methylumidiphilus alinenensis]|uniref:Arc-like DNA binding domain-containing protein n=1 Tax=Candidatus Methylumidiphilus alinenensis TaxID=2202197 RepID=A0A2W4TGX5_9GAMM|nr:MAG: hypothetical protein DM484_03870 [Candidatus Methylumidiphilus alinenensis]
MARTDPQLNIRIPSELKAQLEASAKTSGRSVTAELIVRLEESFRSESELKENWLTQSQEAQLAEWRREKASENAKLLEELKMHIDKRWNSPKSE